MKYNMKYNMKYVFILIIIVVIAASIFYYLNAPGKKKMDHSAHQSVQNNSGSGSNPCTDTLTDSEYLEHMIPHHQVAIDMSKRLLLHTNHSYLMVFCRALIIDQQGEIFHMNNLLLNSYNYDSELLSRK